MDTLSLPHKTRGIAATTPDRGPALYRYTVLMVVWCLVVIVFGGGVTSTNSGMAFPTWPDSDGYWLWPKDINLPGFFEHTHRLWAAGLGLLAIGLVSWVWRTDRRLWMRKVAVAVLTLIIVQGVIGGVGVLKNLPALSSVVHGVLAQTIVCLLTVVAFAHSRGWDLSLAADAGEVRLARRMAVTSLVMVFGQLLVGAILRHTNNTYALWIHVSFALVVALSMLIAAAYIGARFGSAKGFRRMTAFVLGVLLLQLILGFVTLAVRNPKAEASTEALGPAAVQTAHVFVGASLYLLAALMVARTFRNLVPRS